MIWSLNFNDKNNKDDSIIWINTVSEHYLSIKETNLINENGYADGFSKRKRYVFSDFDKNASKFWGNSNHNPYLFLCFIKFTDYKAYNFNKEKKLNYLEANMFLFSSLDDYHCLLALYGEKFHESFDNLLSVIKELENVYDTYTYVAINKNEIDKCDFLKKVRFKFKLKNNERSIDKNVFDKKDIMVRTGNNDYELTITDVSLKDLFNEYLSRFLKATNVKQFDMQILNQTDFFMKSIELNKEVNFNYNGFFDSDEDVKELAKLIKESLYHGDFNPGLIILLEPFLAYCTLTNKNTIINEKNKIYEFQKIFIETITDFTNQGILSKMYKKPFYWNKIGSIPIKMVGYYAALVYNVKNCLIDGKNDRYAFFTIPSKTVSTKIMLLFGNNKHSIHNRLLLMQLPISDIFEIKKEIFSLTHEEFHYVPHKMRNRPLRANCLWKSLILFVDNWMFRDTFKRKSEYFYFDNLNCIKNGKKALYEDENQTSNEDAPYFLRANLKEIYISSLKESRSILFNLFKESKYIQEDNEINMFYESFDAMVVSYEKHLRHLFTLYDECFADLMTKLLLDVDIIEYIEILKNDNSKYVPDGKLNYFNIERMGLVIYTCLGDLDKTEKLLKMNEIKEVDKEIYDFIEKLSYISEDDMKITYSSFPDRINPLIYLYLCKYLGECQSYMLNSLNESEDVNTIRSIYNNATSENLTDCLSKLDELYANYEEEVVKRFKASINN